MLQPHFNGEVSIAMRAMFKSDPKLPDDLKEHRLHDSYKLIKRLENVKKLSCERKKENLSDAISDLLCSLVSIYMETADSIKVSRAVEKLWQPYLTSHSDTIFTAIEAHVIQIISKEDPDQHTTAKISVLFEQNKTAQQVVRHNLGQVTSWIGKQLSVLIGLSPLDLSQTQAQTLYCFVKMSLQLFQICPKELGPALWKQASVDQTSGDTGDTHTSARLESDSINHIVNCLVHILSTKGYHVDCVLLSGTATALLLNTAPDVNTQIQAFNVLLNCTLNQGTRFQFDHLSKVNANAESFVEKLGTTSVEQMGPIALLRGTIVCAGTEFLCYQWKQNKDKLLINSSDEKKQAETDIVTEHNFYQLFTYAQKLCQSDITLHYHAFQILLLWYSRLNKFTSICESTFVDSYAPSVLKSTLDLVLLNWDSPVEDVPEAVVDIFSNMMTLWTKVKDKEPTFCKNILEVLVKTEWHVKGKYRILAALLKYLASKQLLEVCAGIQGQLLQCLSTNHLAPSASAVYRAFLTEIKGNKSTDVVDKWKTTWLDVIVSGLVSNNSLLCHNTSLHWVPATLRLLPAAGSCLLEHLSGLLNNQRTSICHTRLLHAWITVANTTRSLTGAVDLTDTYITEALHSPNEDIRSEAIALVCTTLKKADCLSNTESQLIRESLPYNIKIDSAPFRQHLCSSMKKLLVRLRDSCITMLKSTTENKHKLDCALDFVDWLHRLCIEYLLPGACYQRRKGSLDLLLVLYDCLVYCPDSKQRKGFTPETAVKLLDFAVSTGRWSFFCRDNIDTLIICLLDGADEIRSLAFQLLTRYYTMPLEGNQWGPDSLCCHLVTAALQLCCSPKGHESQSGAILCQLVFQKYVQHHGVGIKLVVGENGGQYKVQPYSGCENPVTHFLNSLLTEIQTSLAQANTNLVVASKKYPVHGLVSALCQCLTKSEGLWSSAKQETVTLLQTFISTCQAIIDQMLAVMAGVAGQEACPSFAEIGMALESLVQENQPEYTEGTALSPEYQYMLSWCWNNIKESCVSLGDIMQTTVTYRLVLPADIVSSMGSTFLTVLTKCRHKGVIEGCRGAYVQFCSALIQSDTDHLQKIPADTLTQVLTSLKSKAVKSSVTRRSAGLPIIIQAVVTSEKKTKKRTLLTMSVSELFEICELPLDDDFGVTDLPQVHGLNILNSLFCDASLAASLMGHVSRAVILVIQQFGSPSWAVCNAATRFFSTLVTRIFGQKKTSSDDDSMLFNSVTFQEFSSYYPELPPFLLEVLKRAAKQDVADIRQIDPGLFPILTLLSFLKPMDKGSETIGRMLTEFADLVRLFGNSPVYQLRHLVAPAFVAMVSMADMMPTAVSILKKFIPCDPGDGNLTLNCIHGNLLVINRLLDYIVKHDDLKLLWTILTERSWLIRASHGMVSGQYIRILYRASQKLPSLHLSRQVVTDLLVSCYEDSTKVGDGVFFTEAAKLLFLANKQEKIHDLESKLLQSKSLEARKACLQNIQSQLDLSDSQQKQILTVGDGVFFTEAVKLLFLANKKEKIHDLESKLLQSSKSLEARKACLQNIQSQLDLADSQRKQILMSILCSSLKHEDYTPNLCLLLNLINFLYLKSFTMPSCDLDQLRDWFKNCYPLYSKCVSVGAAALPVQGILVKQQRGSNSCDIRAWCGLVRSYSQVTNETQRNAAAQALRVIEDNFFQAVPADCVSAESTVSLISACLTLIQDEDTDIRAEACKFVSDLKWSGRSIQHPSVHSNVCFELFLQYISDNLWRCSACVHFLCETLYQHGNLATVYKEKTTTRFQQLFDQEDNSFFAERLYNAINFHSILKGIITRSKTAGEDVITKELLARRSAIADLDVLKEILHTVDKGSLVNICCDNAILANIVCLLLMLDLIAMVTDDKEQQLIRANINSLLMEQKLPPIVQKMITQKCSLS